MIRPSKLLAAFLLIIVYMVLHYAWILIWRGNTAMLNWGDLLTILAGLIAMVWLLSAYRRGEKDCRPLWLLMALGCLSSVIANSIWFYHESILQMEFPFPSIADVFYVLQPLLYLSAFFYQISRKLKTYGTVRFIFDIAIVMTVAISLSWQYVLQPIINTPGIPHLAMGIALAYPIGDLILLLAALGIYFGFRTIWPERLLVLLFAGLLTQIIGDCLFSVAIYEQDMDWIVWSNPCFGLSLMLIGLTGIVYNKSLQQSQTDPEIHLPVEVLKNPDWIRILLPYITVIMLFLIMVTDSSSSHAITLGSGFSILLVIIRQLLMILENRRLIRNLSEKTVALENSEERYRSLFRYHPDAVCSLDLYGNIMSINESASRMLGYQESELELLTNTTFLPEQYRELAFAYFKRSWEGQPQSYELFLQDRAGKLIQVQMTNIPIMVQGHTVGAFAIAKDITEKKNNEERIHYLAYHDPLTGVYNRAAYDEILKRMIAQSSVTRFAVFFIDLDRFKHVNDTLGHDVGDQLLLSVAGRLTAQMPEGSIVARRGGDEFTLILPMMEGSPPITDTAQCMLESLQQPHYIGPHKIVCSPSIGIAIYPDHSSDISTLVQKADRAMYQVKANGKAHYLIYDDNDEKIARKLLLEQSIGTALDNNELLLHYQSQVDASTGKVIGVEALLRWHHPQLGWIPPLEFIPVAEDTGSILSIGRWVLLEACRQAKIWSDQGHAIKMGVNLSPRQFQQGNLADTVAEVLQETDLAPQYLDLEITESIAMSHIHNVIPQLHALKSLGVSISIDDFGTGYSSLSYLASFPIDKLKIAREFISKINERDSHSIIASIINLAYGLNLNIIAEGVEDRQQAEILQGIDCYEMQGYLFSKPVIAAEIEKTFLHNHLQQDSD
ncbi:EAL domain-containing protein [Paenibacillus sp. Z6-24]